MFICVERRGVRAIINADLIKKIVPNGDNGENSYITMEGSGNNFTVDHPIEEIYEAMKHHVVWIGEHNDVAD